MIDNRFHEELTHNGSRIIIDLCEISGGYEAMVLKSRTGEALDEYRSGDFEKAVNAFYKMIERFRPDKNKKPAAAALTGKYAKLRDDLRQALAAGRAAEKANPEDGGTCNFDAASIFLPRWNSAKVEQAAKEAGTNCFDWILFGGRRYVFSPDSKAQANARSRNAEAMTKALKAMGYEAMDYCQAD